MADAPKLLLLAYGAPVEPHAGALFLQTLCKRYPAGRLVRFAVQPHGEPGQQSTWEGRPLITGRRPRERIGGRPLRSLRPLTSILAEARIRRIHAPALAKQAASFGQSEHVDAVWAVLHRPTLIYMARETARRLDVPLVVTVNDPPASFVKDLRWGGGPARRMEAEFAACVRSCHGLGTASEPMRQAYRERYGRESEVLIMGAADEERRPPGTMPAAGEDLVIGFAGSLYARAEWHALLEALAGASWRVAGRAVRVRHVGRPPPVPAFAAEHVEALGWRTPAEATDLMASSHVTYLPYWFDEDRGPSVRLCFPNKLTTYLAAGRPVLYHGPRASSPAEFLARYRAGVTCHSLAADEIRAALTGLFESEAVYAAAVAEGQRALDEELNLDEFDRRFRATVAGT